jgi:hypothetical protein
MKECRSPECLPGLFVSQSLSRQPLQLVVDKPQKMLSGGGIARFDPRQDRRDVGHDADYTAR